MSNLKERKVKQMVVTPDIAAKWLKKNTRNRDIRQAVVDAYALAMKRGQWLLTHEGIAFSVPFIDGQGVNRGETLLDGQHRLLAVVQSGATVEFTVWFNCDPEEFGVIGQSCPRTAGDILGYTRRDLKNPQSAASVVGAFVRFGLGEPLKLQSWVVDTVLAQAEAEIVAVTDAKQKLAKMAPRPITAALVMAQLVNPSQTGVLVKQLKDAIGFTERDPARALHLYLGNQLIGQRDTPDTVFYKVCNAIAAKLEGRSLSVLRVNSDGLVWLRTAGRARLEPICRALCGKVNANFLTPKLIRLGEDREVQNTIVQPAT